MMITGMTAAANIAVRPNMLYHAAMALSVSAVTNANVERLNILLIINGIRIFSAKIAKISVYYSGGVPLPNKYPYVPINSLIGITSFRGIPGPCCM